MVGWGLQGIPRGGNWFGKWKFLFGLGAFFPGNQIYKFGQFFFLIEGEKPGTFVKDPVKFYGVFNSLLGPIYERHDFLSGWFFCLWV